MIQRDYLIIGSGIGGGSACEGVRKYDKRGSVTLVGAEILPPLQAMDAFEELSPGQNAAAEETAAP